MERPITGGCLCGSIRFQSTSAPIATRACWCRDCQYLAAGNASINLIFNKNDLTITGTLQSYQSTADSGNTMQRSFCPHCGTPLFSESSGRSGLTVIRAGALDDPGLGRPQSFIWTDRAPTWGLIDQSLRNHPRQSPAIPSPVGQPPPITSS
ncbi:GFA family protein [Acidiphilium acidophilum]|uniref:GFA family protein n=1 Tax=Acidiphilium acidophilum TaxID=76588 RepID=A0AAW9DQI0_ACIAO|nr:GFA family protein [Acidiphilium acidophilum]MDX5931255.1 GFA family protein [Acidiphilium acidophilum]